MAELLLSGCRTEPLASYLKALGVLRLVGEQVDPTATGRWRGDEFVLRSPLEADNLIEFFLDDYQPTPLVTPWNGGSGFRPKDQQAGIAAIEASSSARLTAYREAIRVGRELVCGTWEQLSKEQQVQLCRAKLPDQSTSWIDATVVLTDDWREFPPLLGTGGNVGRLEFSNNFMQRVAEVLYLEQGRGISPRTDSEEWLRYALMSQGSPRLLDVAIGQFDPGGAGGANSGPVGDAGGLVNPWDYVLLFEGALVFASGAARRLSTGSRGHAVMPFMVEHSRIGYSTAGDEQARGEIWTPVWSRPATAREVLRLIGEGRAEWGGSQSRSGLDFVRSVASLGVDRGIDRFVRYSFVERHGQNMLAVPVGRVSVTDLVAPQVPVLVQLDGWRRRVEQAKNMPAAPAAALRRLDEAQFSVASRSTPKGLLGVLVALAELERAVAVSPELRKAVGSPVASLDARQWAPALDDGSIEFRLAMAFASQGERVTSPPSERDQIASRPALFLRPVQLSHHGYRQLEWRAGPPRVAGLGRRSPDDVLAAFLQLRMIDAANEHQPSPGEQAGAQPAFEFRHSCPYEDVVAYLEGRTDDGRLANLVAACEMLEFSDGVGAAQRHTDDRDSLLPPAYCLLAPFFHGRPIAAGTAQAGVALRPGPSWASLLAAGRVEDVVFDALRRLRVARLTPIVTSAAAMARGADGNRLAAALCFPVSAFGARMLLSRVAILAPRDV